MSTRTVTQHKRSKSKKSEKKNQQQQPGTLKANSKKHLFKTQRITTSAACKTLYRNNCHCESFSSAKAAVQVSWAQMVVLLACISSCSPIVRMQSQRYLLLSNTKICRFIFSMLFFIPCGFFVGFYFVLICALHAQHYRFCVRC